MIQDMQTPITICLILVVILGQFHMTQVQADHAAALVRADSIAAEVLVGAIAENDSTWSAQFITETHDLKSQFLESGDTARARLAEQLSQANVRIALLAEANATAAGQIVSLSDRVGAQADSITALGDVFGSWGGHLNDGLLTGTWAFALPDTRHTLNYSVTVAGELVVAEAGDGRRMVLARSSHERVSLDFGEMLFEPPDPVVKATLSKTEALMAILIGSVGWELIR